MHWLFKSLEKNELYFVDSRTSPNTVAEAVAANSTIHYARRHVFLDNVREQKAIEAQIEKAKSLALKQDLVVAIGHPYPETYLTLQTALHQLERDGF